MRAGGERLQRARCLAGRGCCKRAMQVHACRLGQRQSSRGAPEGAASASKEGASSPPRDTGRGPRPAPRPPAPRPAPRPATSPRPPRPPAEAGRAAGGRGGAASGGGGVRLPQQQGWWKGPGAPTNEGILLPRTYKAHSQPGWRQRAMLGGMSRLQGPPSARAALLPPHPSPRPPREPRQRAWTRARRQPARSHRRPWRHLPHSAVRRRSESTPSCQQLEVPAL